MNRWSSHTHKSELRRITATKIFPEQFQFLFWFSLLIIITFFQFVLFRLFLDLWRFTYNLRPIIPNWLYIFFTKFRAREQKNTRLHFTWLQCFSGQFLFHNTKKTLWDTNSVHSKKDCALAHTAIRPWKSEKDKRLWKPYSLVK